MPTERLPDAIPDSRQQEQATCASTDHFAPNMIVLKPGRYRHTCSRCGHYYEFTIPEKILLCGF